MSSCVSAVDELCWWRQIVKFLEPRQWLDSAERLVEQVGLFGTCVLILVVGLAIGLATRGPGIISGVSSILSVILTHKRERTRINDRIARENRKLDGELTKKIEKQKKRGDAK